MEVEYLENPKRGKDGRFLPATKKKTSSKPKKSKKGTAVSKSTSKYTSKSTSASNTKSKKRTVITKAELQSVIIGVVVAVFGLPWAAEWMNDQATKAAASGQKSWVPDFIRENPQVVAAVAGFIAWKKSKKKGTKLIGIGVMLAAVYDYGTSWYSKKRASGEGLFGVGRTGGTRYLVSKHAASERDLEGMSGAAQRMTADDAARMLGLKSSRPSFTPTSEMGMGRLELTRSRVVDPGVNPNMQQLGRLDVIRGSLRDTGTLGELSWMSDDDWGDEDF